MTFQNYNNLAIGALHDCLKKENYPIKTLRFFCDSLRAYHPLLF